MTSSKAVTRRHVVPIWMGSKRILNINIISRFIFIDADIEQSRSSANILISAAHYFLPVVRCKTIKSRQQMAALAAKLCTCQTIINMISIWRSNLPLSFVTCLLASWMHSRTSKMWQEDDNHYSPIQHQKAMWKCIQYSKQISIGMKKMSWNRYIEKQNNKWINPHIQTFADQNMNTPKLSYHKDWWQIFTTVKILKFDKSYLHWCQMCVIPFVKFCKNAWAFVRWTFTLDCDNGVVQGYHLLAYSMESQWSISIQ